MFSSYLTEMFGESNKKLPVKVVHRFCVPLQSAITLDQCLILSSVIFHPTDVTTVIFLAPAIVRYLMYIISVETWNDSVR